MIRAGFFTSTRMRRAARLKESLRGDPHAGAITPPRYSPFALTTSNVVAVPKSRTRTGAPNRLHRRDRVHDAVGSDLMGVLVQDRQAGLDPRNDEERVLAEPASRGCREDPVPIGDDRRNDHAVDRRRIEPLAREQRAQERAELVRRSPFRVAIRQSATSRSPSNSPSTECVFPVVHRQ